METEVRKGEREGGREGGGRRGRVVGRAHMRLKEWNEPDVSNEKTWR